MTSKRGQSQGWELRLGAVQMVIWLGLAVGAVVGAYFVGFMQGRFVGFETGRSASGVELPKLAVADTPPEGAAQDLSLVYDKLHATGATTESEQPKKKAEARVEESTASKVAQDLKLAEDEKKGAALPVKALETAKPVDSPSVVASNLGNSEALDPFLTGGTPEPDLFDQQEPSDQANLRMLGAVDGAPSAPSDKAKTLGAILDERVDSARGVPPVDTRARVDSADPVLGEPAAAERAVEPVEAAVVEPVVKQPEPTPTRKPSPTPEKKEVVAEKSEKKSQNDIVVKKTLSPGYFAQVAAPTKFADAEAVARKLKKSGFPVVIEEANVKGESYYRVLVGPEDSKVHADRLIQQLQSERYLSSVPFVRKVK